MVREEKLALIERMLGLRHKIKVLDSLQKANSHEELAISWLARWEREDEISAIEGLLVGVRLDNIQLKLKQIQNRYLSGAAVKEK